MTLLRSLNKTVSQNRKRVNNKGCVGVPEMTPQLGALAALAQDPGSGPSAYMGAHNHL